MSTVLLVGTGEVGIRAARQLVDTPGLTRLFVASRDTDRAAEVADAMGPLAAAIPAPGSRVEIPSGVDVVALASDGPQARSWVRAAVAAGVSVASTFDAGLGEYDAAALASDTRVISGCALTPGLSDVLARHAADAFDSVSEVHVARVGGAGPACIEEIRAARKATPGEWRDGSWRSDRTFGPELVWFPDPIGARECQLVAAGVTATVTSVPGVRHVTVRFGPAPSRRVTARLRRDPLDDGWGATRVEVAGELDGMQQVIVYGVVDRMPVVGGVVLAVAALSLTGLAPVAADWSSGGVRALGEAVAPVPYLAELARRGVKAAVFQGVAPAA